MRDRNITPADRDSDNRRHVAPLVALVVAVLAVTVMGPRLVNAFNDRLDHNAVEPLAVTAESQVASEAPVPADDSTATTTAATTAGSTVPTTATPAGAPTTAVPATATTPATSAIPTTAIPATAIPATTMPATTMPATTALPETTAPPAEVVSIQTVPPVRDVIVIVNGKSIASDQSGTITLSPADRHGSIEVIGVEATRTVQQVAFTSWSDGSTAAVRSLDTIAGPTIQLGLSVSSRVIARPSDTVAPGTQLQFSSEAGPLTLTVDQPEWVTSRRAIPSDGGLVTQSLTYSAEAVVVGDASTAVAAQVFVAGPEALWVVALP